ncbi:MAG: hypothetical protein ACMUIG_05080 [Thermoplasmatota archaeon]
MAKHSLFGKGKGGGRRSSIYEIRISDSLDDVRIRDSERGKLCRIDRHPDDMCEFYDENNIQWTLFGFAKKQFNLGNMIHQIAKKHLEKDNRHFMARVIHEFGSESGLSGMSSEGKANAIKGAVIGKSIDMVRFSERMRYAPVTDLNIENSVGKVAVIVRKDPYGTKVTSTGEIIEVKKI